MTVSRECLQTAIDAINKAVLPDCDFEWSESELRTLVAARESLVMVGWVADRREAAQFPPCAVCEKPCEGAVSIGTTVHVECLDKVMSEDTPMRNGETAIYPGQDESACQTCLKCQGTGREVTVCGAKPYVRYGARCADCFDDDETSAAEDANGGCNCGQNCDRGPFEVCPLEVEI